MVKGPKAMEILAVYNNKFKEFLGKELVFEEKKQEEKENESKQSIN